MNLRIKLLVPLLVFALVVAGYLRIYWIPESSRQAEEAQARLIGRHIDSVVEGLVPLLLGSNLDTVYENLNALRLKNGEWSRIRLLGEKGVQL